MFDGIPSIPFGTQSGQFNFQFNFHAVGSSSYLERKCAVVTQEMCLLTRINLWENGVFVLLSRGRVI